MVRLKCGFIYINPRYTYQFVLGKILLVLAKHFM